MIRCGMILRLLGIVMIAIGMLFMLLSSLNAWHVMARNSQWLKSAEARVEVTTFVVMGMLVWLGCVLLFHSGD